MTNCSITSVSIVCEAVANIPVSYSSSRIKVTSFLLTTTKTILNYSLPAMTQASTLNYRTLAPALTLSRHLITRMKMLDGNLETVYSIYVYCI